MPRVVFVAPAKAYQISGSNKEQRIEQAGWTLPAPVGLTRTGTGGLATIFPGHPFPRKTFIFWGVTNPNNNAKRIFLSLFLPFASLKEGLNAFLNSYLLNFNRLIDSIYNECEQIPYLGYEYYSEFGKALWHFIYFFLKKIGIKDSIAYRTGLQIATMIEYDDAYMVRLQDIFSESSKEALYNNFRKETLRLMDIYSKRENHFDEKDLMQISTRIVKIVKLMGWLMYIPRVKKAFRFALDNVNYEWFKFDNWDLYWTFFREDYNVKGVPLDKRVEAGKKIIEQYAKKETVKG